MEFKLKPTVFKKPDVVVLSYEQFLLLKDIIMAYPEGMVVSLNDQALRKLIDHRFVQQKGFRWFPTEAGLHNIMPRKKKAA